MNWEPRQAATRHLLLITDHLTVGGIETLMSRVAHFLTTRGWRVTLIIERSYQDALRIMPKEVVVMELGKRFRLLYFPEYARYFFSKQECPIDLIYGCTLVGCWLGSICSLFLPNHPALVCGVYTSWEFCYPKSKRFIHFGDYLRAAQFDKNIVDTSKLFMSEAVRQNHVQSFGRSLDTAPICLLPIDARMFKTIERRPKRFKVVSVGRLCGWKTYNLYMIPVVKQMRDKGSPVHWHVYGTGELEPEMRRRIHESGLEDRIHLHGNLEYRRYPEVLADAGAFVGMGTALIEAGFARVPSVVALEHAETQKTYGYLHELPIGACGERFERQPTCDTADLLERLFLMTDADYAREMESTWNYVQPFDQEQVFQNLLRCFQNAQACRGSYLRFAAYNLHGLYRKACRRLG